jgi:hypothetical protein
MWSIKEPEIDQDTRSEETFALRDTLVTIRNIADNIPLSYKTINIPISGGKFRDERLGYNRHMIRPYVA